MKRSPSIFPHRTASMNRSGSRRARGGHIWLSLRYIWAEPGQAASRIILYARDIGGGIIDDPFPPGGDDGLPSQRLGMMQDITDRAEIEQIEKLGNEYTLILNAVSEGLFGLDPYGKVTFINPAGAYMLDFECDDILGLSYRELIHQTSLDGIDYLPEEAPLMKAIHSGVSHQEQGGGSVAEGRDKLPGLLSSDAAL